MRRPDSDAATPVSDAPTGDAASRAAAAISTYTVCLSDRMAHGPWDRIPQTEKDSYERMVNALRGLIIPEEQTNAAR